jgi:hypothetical protein
MEFLQWLVDGGQWLVAEKNSGVLKNVYRI